MSANCAYASTIGDVHAHTVAGLAYDFQGVGDDELAQVGADFEAQARHVSGAPTWPNASVNQAIGTRMGKTTVAVCGPQWVVVDGRAVRLTEGRPYATPDGVVVTFVGGVYIVTDATGNSVRVTPQPGYLDVSVGVGTWPTTVRGRWATRTTTSAAEASDGTIFSVPLSFTDLYDKFGDSWRVKPATSLLAPCGTKVEESNPSKPVSRRRPRPEPAGSGRCRPAGTGRRLPAGLAPDACTLDVASHSARRRPPRTRSDRPPVSRRNK